MEHTEVAKIPSNIPGSFIQSHGAILLPEDSTLIDDADEEIFLLYTSLQGAPSQDSANLRGLGYLDSKQDIVELRFDLTPTPVHAVHLPGKRKSKLKRTPTRIHDASFEYQLIQDKTALRSRKGDTGSVVWKASIDLARFILQEHAYPSGKSLFDGGKLKDCHIVELGAGTGLLSLVTSSMVKRYTVTDTVDLVNLIRKNVKQNFAGWPNLAGGSAGSNITIEPLDWVQLQKCNEAQRLELRSNIPDPIDITLVVDCIYHPSLIPPLLTTIDHLATPGVTKVLVISELRSEEVLREFLESWLAIPGWRIWNVGGDLLQDRRYVLWMGEKY